MTDPEISIVIVSWNVRDLLIACLRSIERFVTTPHEVVVVDNDSHDQTVAEVTKQFPRVVIIVNKANEGFAKACNQGWRKTRGRFIFFLNPDTLCINDPFPPLIDYAAHHQRVGCLGPELLNADRSHQPSVRRLPHLSDQAFILLKLHHLVGWLPPLRSYFADPGANVTVPTNVEQLMGAAMLFPRAVLEQAGTFDEGYWIWFEEVDLCRRLRARGYDIVYHPSSHLIHLGGQSFAQHLSMAKHIWFMKSLVRYANRYWSLPSRIVLYLFLPISYVLTVFQSFFKPK